MATCKSLLSEATNLKEVSDSPRLDVELLLSYVLDCDRIYFLTWPEKQVSVAQEQLFFSLLSRRQKGEPIAHIIGMREFWSLPLKVSASTLIPRPDTETLVELALERCDHKAIRALDLGTGSGAIALALASERPNWHITAVDSQADAVALAKENSQQLNLSNTRIILSDWFNAVKGSFDLIVSNPPYIAEHDPHLNCGDVRFEPLSALTAANNGLADLNYIATGARHFLNKGGLLIMEHGSTQGQAVHNTFLQQGYSQIETQQDLAGLDRVTLGYWKP